MPTTLVVAISVTGQKIPRGERTWLLRVYMGRDAAGKRTYLNKTFHGTSKEADKALRKLLTSKDDDGLMVPTKETVGKYLDTWLKTSVKPRLRARTHHDYSYVVEQYIKPELGRFKLSALRANNVRKSYNQLAERGLGSQVIRQAHAVLHTALERARKDKLIAVNPATTAKEDALPRREKKEREWLKPNHARRFLEAAAGDRFGALWHLMITGDLRPAEGLGLKWQDIEGEGVHVRRSLIERGAEEMHFAEPRSGQ